MAQINANEYFLRIVIILLQVLHRQPRSGSSKSAHHADADNPLAQSGTIVICNSDSRDTSAADTGVQGVSYTTSSWLLNCIAQYKLLDFDWECLEGEVEARESSIFMVAVLFDWLEI